MHPQSGTVTVYAPGRIPFLERFWAEIELGDGEVLSTCQGGLEPGAGHWCSTVGNGRIRLELSLSRSSNPAGVLVSLAVRNLSEAPVPVTAMRVMRMSRSLPHAAWGHPASWSVLRMGYAFGGAHDEDPDTRNSALVKFEAPLAQTRSWGQLAIRLSGDLRSAVFSRYTAGAVLGFVTARRWMGWIDAGRDGDHAEISASNECAGRVLGPGAVLESEPLYAGVHADPLEGLKAYAALNARRMEVRLKPVPHGWCSWYGYGKGGVSEASMLEHARLLAGVPPSLHGPVVQLDDGYHVAYGDWLETNDRFPGGLDGLARGLVKLGVRPGLWLAPFVAQASSKLFARHPDWMVKEEGGGAKPVDVPWAEPKELWYGLDGSHPEVQDWLRWLFSRLRKWGFAYFKLDFLFMGCLKGVRARQVSRVEAYRAGLGAIRAGARDAYLLGCTAPYPPSVGLVDGMRVSHDVLTGEDFWKTFRESSRETHQRGWAHRRLWNADHDVVVLRSLEGVSPDTNQAAAASVALSGGARFSGDPLPDLLPGQLDRVKAVLVAPPGRAADPSDLFDAEYPRLLVFPLGRRHFRVGVFNHSDVPRTVKVELAALGLARARWWVLENDRRVPGGAAHGHFLTPPVPGRGAVTMLVEGR